MQIPLVGFVAGTNAREEGTNRKTGEVIKEDFTLDILVPDKSTHVIQKVKCSRSFMERYAPMKLAKDAVLKPVQILCDMIQWEMNGNKGVTFRAVETAAQ